VQQPEHPDVPAVNIERELGHAPVLGVPCESLEQRPADAVALVLVDDGDTDIGALRVDDVAHPSGDADVAATN